MAEDTSPAPGFTATRLDPIQPQLPDFIPPSANADPSDLSGEALEPAEEPAAADLRVGIQTNDPDATVIVRFTGSAIFSYIRAVERCGGFQAMEPLSGFLLLILLNRVNGKAVRKSGRLLCWPGIPYLAKQTSKSPGHVKRALRQLVSLGLVKRTKMGGGKDGSSVYRLVIPRELNASARSPISGHGKPKTAGQRGGGCSAGATGGAGAQARLTCGAGAPYPGAPARHINTEIEIRRIKPPPQAENRDEQGGCIAGATPARQRLPEVVVVALEKLDIGPRRIEQLAALPASTPEILLAGCLQAGSRPPEHRAGKAIRLIQEPGDIAGKFIDRAKAAIDRAARPPSARAAASGGGGAEAAIRSQDFVEGLEPGRREELLAAALAQTQKCLIDTWRKQGTDPLDVPSVRAQMQRLAREDA